MSLSKNIVQQPEADGYINVPVTRETRQGLHELKEAMQVSSQAEVIEKEVVPEIRTGR